ncbi:MAG TPA: T9SS type A sorting domain-containing protein, partial [Ignavibacteria bacterium]|nr:T9SS type A sorting domain-containing protein [Ignavibacteria bacterium]
GTPREFALNQNYPNPFNPTTNIQYDIPNDVFVSIKVYDMLGREVAELVNEVKNAGRYIVGFNGSKLSSGIYYYKIKAGSFEQTRRMVLIK